MQFRYFFLTILLFLVSEDFGFAQQSTERKWTLPEGTIAHLAEEPINDIAYSPDGGLLAAANANGIWLYDTVTHQEVARLVGHTRPVVSISFSPEGKTLASGDSGGRVNLWDVATGTLLWSRTEHHGRTSVSFSPGGKTLASGAGQRFNLWDVATQGYSAEIFYRISIQSVSFSPDARMLAIGALDKTVRLWDTATDSFRHTLEGHTDSVKCCL
ncbi:MAG: hypothetical protein OXN27_26275 [Candidatus Poribacteria bacterium]|nr:hypothetical protein [Candidatus Poribacteria bacterium]